MNTFLKSSLLCIITLLITACSGSKKQYYPNYPQYSYYNQYPLKKHSPPRALSRKIRIKRDILPRHSRSRTNRHMTPRFITIHSTQNWKKGADASRHALALRRGALGRIGWHFTVDDSQIIQHIPANEQGNHAENYRGGPGNKYSLGIEMCENPDNNRSRTIKKTAKLTAYLMHKHGIPLRRVVPHYHWPRKGYRVAHKNCPHFLLDNGRPGRKWRRFLKMVNGYYKDMK